MSGITGTSYRVESAAEIELRRHREALAQYRSASAELDGLQVEADAYRKVYGERVQRVPTVRRVRRGADAATLERANAKVQDVISESRGVLRQQVADASRQDLSQLFVAAASPAEVAVDATTALVGHERSDVTDGGARQDPAAERRAELADRAAARHADMVERAERLVGEIPARTEPRERDRLRRTAVEIATSPGRARMLLDSLGRSVEREKERDEAAARVVQELTSLTARLEPIGGASAAGLRRHIADLLASPPDIVPTGLADQVDGAVVAADLARQKKITAAALRRSLSEMGYGVSEGFETVLATDGAAYARIPGVQGYGIKVLLDRDRAVFRTRLVRGAETADDASVDKHVEKSFCDARPALLKRLQRDGIPTEDVGIREPGDVRVQVVDDRLIPAAQVHSRTGHQQREQTR